MKNKVTTCGYFIKRLRDNGYTVNRIFNEYYNPSTKKNHPCDSKFLNKRPDDNEKIIINRFETYLNETLPILDFYKKQNLLHQINGMAEIDQIFDEICGIIASLET